MTNVLRSLFALLLGATLMLTVGCIGGPEEEVETSAAALFWCPPDAAYCDEPEEEPCDPEDDDCGGSGVRR